MSYSILKNIPGFFGQPAGIATLASLGLHGMLGLALPLFPNPKAAEKPPEKMVPLVTLTPEEQSRLPLMNPNRMATPGVIAQAPAAVSSGLLLPPMPPPLSTSLIGGTQSPVGNYAISSVPKNQPANMRIGRLGDKTTAKYDSSQQAFIDKKGQSFPKYTSNKVYDPSNFKVSEKLKNSTPAIDNSTLPNVEPAKLASLPTTPPINLQNPDNTPTAKPYVPPINPPEPAQIPLPPLTPNANNVSPGELNFSSQPMPPGGVIRLGGQPAKPVNPYGAPRVNGPIAFGSNLGNQSVGTKSPATGFNLGNQSVGTKAPLGTGSNSGSNLSASSTEMIASITAYKQQIQELSQRYPNYVAKAVIREQLQDRTGLQGVISGNLVVEADGKVIDFIPTGKPSPFLVLAAKRHFQGYFQKEPSGKVRLQPFMLYGSGNTSISNTPSTSPANNVNQKLNPNTPPSNQTSSLGRTTQTAPTSTGQTTVTSGSNNTRVQPATGTGQRTTAINNSGNWLQQLKEWQQRSQATSSTSANNNPSPTNSQDLLRKLKQQ